MTREIALHCMKSYSELHSDLCELCPIYGQTGSDHCFEDALQYVIGILEQEPCEDCISRVDALRVAKNEYLRGWHNALCKALSEKYSIHCEEGNFSVIQEETIKGLGLSMNSALGKDVESYMSTMPRVAPQESILDKIDEIITDALDKSTDQKESQTLRWVLDKIRAEIEQRRQRYEVAMYYIDAAREQELSWVLEVIDKYKAESEG